MSLDASGAERDQIIEISTLLLPWCRDGNYGALFDGASNLSLTGKIAHFELGYIPDSAKELRAAAGFLITNHARKHIITLPRALRKRNVYEEVARFLDIPGGEEIVKESYAQLRKFNCWNISIVQQYARFKQSRIRSAVFGNSRQFFLMRQNDRADLDDIARDIAIPEITKHTIMNYTLPDHQAGAKYSAFTYLHVDSNRPICGTAYNYHFARNALLLQFERRTFRAARQGTARRKECHRRYFDFFPQTATRGNHMKPHYHHFNFSRPIAHHRLRDGSPRHRHRRRRGRRGIASNLSHGNPAITAAGAAGGVLVSEGANLSRGQGCRQCLYHRLRERPERRREAAVLDSGSPTAAANDAAGKRQPVCHPHSRTKHRRSDFEPDHQIPTHRKLAGASLRQPKMKGQQT